MNSNGDSEQYALVVDDDPDALEILSRIVGSLGLNPHIASDGMQAVDALGRAEDQLPVLVLLDLLMPGLDGFGVLRWLRANPVTRRVPVIVVTACDPNHVDMLRLPGVVEVVRKGEFTVLSLTDLIRKTIQPDSV